MIIGVDIGGTKTYLACFSESGKLLREVKFDTNHDYDTFLTDLEQYARKLETKKAKIACAAVPGLLDRENGIVKSLGNLPWKDRYIQHDIAATLGIEHTYIENDSKLAGLAEARHISDEFQRVFYLTISTGIGGALVVNGQLLPELLHMEIGKSPLMHRGKIEQWEEFASGRAFVKKYGKKAVDVSDQKVWEEFAQVINQGVGIICSTFQVEAIVFGGGLGQHLEKFKQYITPYLQEHLHAIVLPPKALLACHYKTQSVIYGCYEYAKDHLA